MKFGTPVQPRCVAISAPFKCKLRSLKALVSPRRCIMLVINLVAIIITLRTQCQFGGGGFELPHSLTSTQREYLEFLRDFIRKNESSPRLEEIAEHFSVKAPTAHKILEALQSKGYLYFGRDPVSGFFIRLIERAGSTEVVMEVPIAGRVGAYGKVYDFPQNLGHFASVFIGATPGNVAALAVTENIPQANMLSGDLIIFDLE